MGIENHATWLKTVTSHNYPLYKFRGRRIGIDASIWVNANKHVLHATFVKKLKDIVTEDVNQFEVRKVLYRNFRLYINRYLSHSITPVFVFDGSAPEGKTETQRQRRANKQKRFDTITTLKAQLSMVPDYQRSPEMLKELRDAMNHAAIINHEDFDDLKAILTEVGLPWIQARGEAEELGSSLCRRNRIAAFVSTDTDCIAHQCPLWIKEVYSDKMRDSDTQQDVVTVKLYIYRELLRDLKVTAEQMTDVCIISGCDYNTQIKRFTGVPAIKAMLQYGSYANLPADKKDPCQNYEYCKEQFRLKDFPEITDMNTRMMNINPNALSQSRNFLTFYGLEEWIPELMYYYQHVPVPEDSYSFSPFPPRIAISMAPLDVSSVQPVSQPFVQPTTTINLLNPRNTQQLKVIETDEKSLNSLLSEFEQLNIKNYSESNTNSGENPSNLLFL